MTPVAFIDANVPIYAAGRDHPYKEPCARILRILADDPQSFVTDSEVLQEMMHRYLASGRWNLGREVVRAFAEAMRGRVEPVHGGRRYPGDGVGRPLSGSQRPRSGPRCGDAKAES